jgi:hypothetical protein
VKPSFDGVFEEEKKLARQRQKAAAKRTNAKLGRGQAEETLPGISRKRDARDVAADVTGYSEKALRLARFVVRHAEDELRTLTPRSTDGERSVTKPLGQESRIGVRRAAGTPHPRWIEHVVTVDHPSPIAKMAPCG